MPRLRSRVRDSSAAPVFPSPRQQSGQDTAGYRSCSSVAEHSLGKGEVGSSILPMSTTRLAKGRFRKEPAFLLYPWVPARSERFSGWRNRRGDFSRPWTSIRGMSVIDAWRATEVAPTSRPYTSRQSAAATGKAASTIKRQGGRFNWLCSR